MSEELQVLYMESRLVRLATKEWNMSRNDVVKKFKDNHVYKFIADLWGIFHVEGDYAVLDDIEEYLKRNEG